MSKAICKAQYDALAEHQNTVLIGEDIGKLGGVFRATDGLSAEFGDDRVITSPLGEAGIIGTGLGMALNGFRVIAEIQFEGFIFTAFNQIVTQVSRMRYRLGEKVPLHLVIRFPSGSSGGAVEHHQESPESILASIPGIRIVYATNANDGYWLLKESIDLGEPVIFLEAKNSYWKKGQISPTPPDKPLGAPEISILNEGSDITLITWGPMVNAASKAASVLAQQHNISAEVIDLRYLFPIDWDGLGNSLAKTKRAVICHETSNVASLATYLGFELVSRFKHLKQLPSILGTAHEPLPPANRFSEFIPQVDDLVNAALAQF